MLAFWNRVREQEFTQVSRVSHYGQLVHSTVGSNSVFFTSSELRTVLQYCLLPCTRALRIAGSLCLCVWMQIAVRLNNSTESGFWEAGGLAAGRAEGGPVAFIERAGRAEEAAGGASGGVY